MAGSLRQRHSVMSEIPPQVWRTTRPFKRMSSSGASFLGASWMLLYSWVCIEGTIACDNDGSLLFTCIGRAHGT